MSKDSILIVLGDFVAASAMNPYQILDTLEYDVDMADPHKQEGESVKTSIPVYVGDDRMFTERRGRDLVCTIDFEKVDPAAYDGIVLPGGRAPEYLSDVEAVRSTVRAFDEEGKPIAANCHGVQIVAAAGIVDGRRCTSISRLQPILENAGAEWVEPAGSQGDQSSVVTDGNLITASQSSKYPEMMRAFVDRLEGESI